MNTYTILSTLENVSIVSDKNDIMFAMVDGKLYDITTGKPYNHGGRQLREVSRNLISTMRSAAYDTLEELKNEREMVINDAIAEALAEQSFSPLEAPPQAPASVSTLESMIADTVAKYATEKALDGILPAIREKVLAEFGPLPVKHEISIPEKKPFESTEIFHADFDKICSILLDNRYGKEAVYLCGPAGTGKSYIAKQVARAFELPYYSANQVTDDVALKGYKDAMGNYHGTEFREAFENGGVFLLDELDASIPEVLVLLNNALANGDFPFPDKHVSMNENFHCIAAGNTYGTGADSEYTGRFSLDASTMDRFSFVPVDYDNTIELNMANGDENLVKFAHDFRKAVKSAGIHCLFTYRAIRRLSKFTDYMTKEEALQMGLTKGLDKSDLAVIATAIDSIKTGETAWTIAFNTLVSQ